MYKLREGLDEEGIRKLETELDRTARRIHHPLDEITAVKVFPDTETPTEKKAERQPPPGWKSEKEAFASAMSLMTFVGAK